jgi:ADP-ribose pyrophosphatase YjhB (NUDIX family)
MSSDSYVNYCPSCGNPTTRKFVHGRDRPVCDHCGRIHFEEPKVAAGALVIQEGKVLLVRRIMEPKRGMWSLPAGFVDADEDPAAAAIREVREETGMDIEIEGLLDVFHGKEHPSGASIVIIYTGSVRSGKMVAGDDVDGVEFFDPANLPPIAFEATQKALRHIQQNKPHIMK